MRASALAFALALLCLAAAPACARHRAVRHATAAHRGRALQQIDPSWNVSKGNDGAAMTVLSCPTPGTFVRIEATSYTGSATCACDAAGMANIRTACTGKSSCGILWGGGAANPFFNPAASYMCTYDP